MSAPARNSFAASRLVNPPGAAPLLTEEQVWKGLGIKARKPETFVPVITSCEVLSDEGNKIVRSVSFNNGAPAIERVELHDYTIAYFELESTGMRVTNVLSYDAVGALVLTFSFANGIPGGTEGKSVADLNAMAGNVIGHTIERIRELVVQGAI
ncbi:hypothetical protein C0991_007664 [Blastosporella zonata]|nr:hypothetical protein C0991_007664 [Blastosporella zonata]